MHQSIGTRLDNLRRAPRCEARTRAGPPCQCPAMRGRKRCHIENAVIVDVEATPARTYDEVAARGWSRRRKSSRTSRCGRRAIGWPASSPVRISTGTGNAEPTSAPAGNCCRPAAPSMTDARCCTAPQSGTAIYARYERSAAPRPMRARSRATSMRMPAISHGGR
jgi:hypothetical protein